MAMQVSQQYERTNLGLLMARQSAPVAYTRQMDTAAPAEKEPGAVDSVSLSANVPKPLTADTFRDARAVAKTIAESGRLDNATSRRLREDRVFTAVSALALLGEQELENGQVRWPGGIPAPSSEELEEARRRLTQRLSRAESTPDPSGLQDERLELLRRLGGLALPEMNAAAS